MNPKKPRSPGLQALHDRYIGDDPERIASLGRARIEAKIATALYEMRNKEKISQNLLATWIGVDVADICDIEDSDFDGDAWSILLKSAATLGYRVEIDFVKEVNEENS